MTCERLRQIRLVLLIHFRTVMTAMSREVENEPSKSSLAPRRCGGGRESFNMLARLSNEYDIKGREIGLSAARAAGVHAGLGG